MPELPEVESVRSGLNKVLIGQTIRDVEVNNGKIVFSHSNIRQNSKAKTSSFINNITNKKIVKVSRRAKNIIIELSDESIILIHLKMTGQLVYVGAPSAHPQEKIIGGISPRPISIFHCDKDDYVESSHAQRLFAAAREPKEVWTPPCNRHERIWNVHREEAERRAVAFFKKNL